MKREGFFFLSLLPCIRIWRLFIAVFLGNCFSRAENNRYVEMCTFRTYLPDHWSLSSGGEEGRWILVDVLCVVNQEITSASVLSPGLGIYNLYPHCLIDTDGANSQIGELFVFLQVCPMNPSHLLVLCSSSSYSRNGEVSLPSFIDGPSFSEEYIWVAIIECLPIAWLWLSTLF